MFILSEVTMEKIRESFNKGKRISFEMVQRWPHDEDYHCMAHVTVVEFDERGESATFVGEFQYDVNRPGQDAGSDYVTAKVRFTLDKETGLASEDATN